MDMLEATYKMVKRIHDGMYADTPVLPGTEPDEPTEPKPVYMDPNKFWPYIFEAGNSIDVGPYGVITFGDYPRISGRTATLMRWEWDGLEKGVQYFGLAADLRSGKLNRFEPMFNELFKNCGPRWRSYITMHGNNSGTSVDMTGVPVDMEDCGKVHLSTVRG